MQVPETSCEAPLLPLQVVVVVLLPCLLDLDPWEVEVLPAWPELPLGSLVPFMLVEPLV